MVSVSSVEMQQWLLSFLWPLTRILGLLAAAPVFGHIAVPLRIKVSLGILIALTIAPGLTALPSIDPTSFEGVLILGQQFLIGTAMGFVMRLVFEAISLAGEVTGLTMGLGFATFFDPQSHGRSSAISQFYVLLALLIYLATNMHLYALAALADSFQSIPMVSGAPVTHVFSTAAESGARIFLVGAQLSLPMVAALLITNLAMGILTRAAPQLNLFGIGFPVTIGAGFLVIALVLPYLTMPIERAFHEGVNSLQHDVTKRQIRTQ